MTPPTLTGLIWDEATDEEALELARAFESAWKASTPGRRPDPALFLRQANPSRRGDLLAILRVDLALRRRIGEDVGLEVYRDRFPGLHPDAFVALLYEDYCLREEAGDAPDAAGYAARFPEVTARLRELLEIHDLVAEPGSTSSDQGSHPGDFPEAGETIAGFRLVEELGRGSFARVFLAQERQLGDRRVALKVSRTGSREPQTLARLQHTHIVPVHSYRTDPATGLHLLCMPFFGRVTLAGLLADGRAPESWTGGGIVASLDRLGGSESPDAARSNARGSLSSRSYPRAIAWWGARMAEALQHAHDRGVLHRDVKPSNVLIAGDGMPMLLDFNLSRDLGIEGLSPSKLGGTLAYMAPEHLEALAAGHDEGIDHRADLYSLGMVLLEALGSKPVGGPSLVHSLAESLTWLIAHRRQDLPRFASQARPIPPALEAVVRLCLAPARDDRYASAADLAVDLQAVADDAPLAFAREPMAARVARWLRRNRTRLAIAAPLILAGAALLILLFRAQAESIRSEAQARELIRDGMSSSNRTEYLAAAAQFSMALARLADRTDLGPLRDEARRRLEDAEAADRIRGLAVAFFERAEPLRYALLGFAGDREEASRSMVNALDPVTVLEEGDWAARVNLGLLDPPRRSRLLREVDDCLFFWVYAAAKSIKDRPSPRERDVAVAYCDLSLRFTDRPRPWLSLRDWWRGAPAGRPKLPPDPADERSAAACFRWYLLGNLGRDRGSALAWLRRATCLEPSGYWHQFALAFELGWDGRPDLALPACDAAVALRPDSPWPREARAGLFDDLGRWREALDELDEALAACRTRVDEARVRLARGLIHQKLGEFAAARSDAELAILADPYGRIGRDAGLNLARLEADSGRPAAALARYDALIASHPSDLFLKRGRIRLLLRMGRADLAEAELGALLNVQADEKTRPQFLAERATARLASNRPREARVDAEQAFGLEPSPANARLRDRARLALGDDLESWPDRPDAFDGWPDGGRTLRDDLLAAARRVAPDDHRRKAILFSAAGDRGEALAEADLMLVESSASVADRRTRARIKLRAGLIRDALDELSATLRDAPEDPASLELRGIIRVEQGEYAAGLVDLKVAEDRGASGAVGPAMARALFALGRPGAAVGVWSRLVEADPLDATAHLGLALASIRVEARDRAFVALEDAAALVGDGSPILIRIALAQASFLPWKSDRLPRLIGLLKRMQPGRPR